ncbi:ABC-2 type transporter [Gluconacetobacter diazotrophicus PA1 5]|uniref:ABC transporter permease n=1 Tax=Gluconacetobacter diazotrophicus TaxID=33996 RepID=UPI000173AF6B|nr:ABC transporter permease [Gluconacetobacter diazotrophicus]ACI50452.1 ABC-2 type transporter [Gluconacetobacter diazotrophicus PA1 5]TWA98318.1 capsular polysaccharide transport system permease protein [Gluconacetobacter diazotrophicus]
MNTPSLLTLFRVQMRVIGALLIRELHTRFGRENLGYLWIVGEPILFCAGVAIAWTAIRPAHEHGLQTTAIVITGYVPLTMWRHCLAQSVHAFNANGSLLFHRQVTPLDLILTRVILEVMGALIAGLIVTVGAIILGFMKPPADYGLLYLGIFYHVLFCLGTALVVAPLSEMSELLEKTISVISYLSLPVSGAFMMVDWIPQHYRWILLLSPSVNSIEMVRGGQFGYSAHAHYDLVYDSWATVTMILLGLSLTLRVRRHILVQ